MKPAVMSFPDREATQQAQHVTLSACKFGVLKVAKSPQFSFSFTEFFGLASATPTPAGSMGVLTLGNRPLSRSNWIF